MTIHNLNGLRMFYVQTRAFHNVAKFGGFSSAASNTGQSQSVLSSHVKQLEATFDIQLFKREKRQVSLTPAGQELYLLTQKFFDIEDQISEHLLQSSASLSGKLRIVVDSAVHILKPLLRFRKRYPDTLIDLNVGNSSKVIDTLRSYNSDIGVVGSPITGNDVGSIPIGTSKIQAVASRKYFNNLPKSLTFQELKNLPLIFREEGSYTREQLIKKASLEGVKLSSIIQVSGREALHDLVAQGLGIGFVSRAEISRDQRLVAIEIAAGEIQMTERLVYLRARQEVPIVRAFLKVVKGTKRKS